MGTVEIGQVESYSQLQSGASVISDEDDGGTIYFDNVPKPRRRVVETTWGALKSSYK